VYSPIKFMLMRVITLSQSHKIHFSQAAMNDATSKQDRKTVKVKILPQRHGPQGDTYHGALSPQPDTSFILRDHDGYGVVYLFIPQLLLVLTALSHGGMARLS